MSTLLTHSSWNSDLFAITIALLALPVSSVFRDTYDKESPWNSVCLTCSAQEELLLKANILSAYKIDKVLELTNNFLELLVLEMLDQPFGMLISMSMFMLLWAGGLDSKLRFKEKYVFAKSLLGTTIQDGNMRERSNTDLCYLFLTLTIILAKSNIYKHMIFIITII